ncbi:MAG: NACHT domain-containing protein [Bacteroidia bacterium]
MKSKQDKLDFLHSISKEVELHALLEELLPEMGFEDVKVTHEKGNKPEFGKDVVCSRHDKLENKKDWYAFVVKKGTIAGNASSVREVQDQVYECFKYPYKSIEQKKKIPINKVKVVTNQHFSSGAKDKVFESNPDDRANVDFWDDERLITFIDEYYPKFWVRGSKQYKKYIERLQERIKVDSLVKSLSLNNKKVERILNNAIEPRLSERITNEDGSIKMVQKSANTIISIPDNSIIIGEPGAGKSTLFKILSNEIITQNSLRNNQDFYPITLTFKEVEQNDFNIEKAIESFFNREWNYDLHIDWKSIIQTESCAIFIDALDELPIISSKEKALESLKAFREKHPNIKIICSSRPSDYLFHNCETIGFRYLEIEQLNGKQVQQFLNNYFGEDIIKSKSLLKSLKDSAILEKLPKTPLTIALITILFDEKEVEIPATITDLYEMFVNLLIGKTEPKDNVELIEIGIKHRLLCHIAKHLHTNLIQKLTRQELFDVLQQYSTERGQPLDIDIIIDEILDQVGLLFINNKGEIAFKHQSFQEYFTAYEIFHHRQSDRKLFVNNFNDLWWQNVAIFYAGMTKDAPTLLDEILEASDPTNLSELISNRRCWQTIASTI